MPDLIILGTGVHAAEMAEIVVRVNGHVGQESLGRPWAAGMAARLWRAQPLASCPEPWNLLGFLSAKGEGVGETRNGYPILGSAEAIPHHPDALFVPDNEWPRDLLPSPDRLASLIDPTSFVSAAATIGAGCVLYPHCFIGLNARLGDCVFSLSSSVINHDCTLGDWVVLASRVTFAGHVTVEEDCYLGQACSAKEYLTIGRGSLIGMGAVVLEDVPPNSVMVGNPARRLRDRR